MIHIFTHLYTYIIIAHINLHIIPILYHCHNTIILNYILYSKDHYIFFYFTSHIIIVISLNYFFFFISKAHHITTTVISIFISTLLLNCYIQYFSLIIPINLKVLSIFYLHLIIINTTIYHQCYTYFIFITQYNKCTLILLTYYIIDI